MLGVVVPRSSYRFVSNQTRLPEGRRHAGTFSDPTKLAEFWLFKRVTKVQQLPTPSTSPHHNTGAMLGLAVHHVYTKLAARLINDETCSSSNFKSQRVLPERMACWDLWS